MEEINRISRAVSGLEAAGKPPQTLFSGNPVREGFVFPRGILESEFARFMDKSAYEPVPNGDPDARAAISAFYARRGISAPAETIQITCGTSESYHYLFSMLAKSGDNVLMPCPSYPLLEHIGRMSGVELRHYRMDEAAGWKIDLRTLSRFIDRHTRAIVLISPHNPTGNIVSADEIAAIAGLAARTGAALICDEVFSEFVFDSAAYPSAAACKTAPLVFTLDGLSKMCALPWLKLGWIAVGGADGKRVKQSLCDLEMTADLFLSANSFAQSAAAAILAKGRDFMKAYSAAVEERKNTALAVLENCPHLSFERPRGGFYITAKVEGIGMDEEELCIRLIRDHGLYAYPGYFFDIEPESHLILSFLPEPGILKTSLQRLKDALGAIAEG